MATKTPITNASKHRNTSSANISTSHKHKWYKGLLPIALGLGMITLGAVLAMNKVNESTEYTEETTAMAQYLQSKYGKEFVVENYRIEGLGLGVPGTPVADAYPVDDSLLRFEVRGESVFYDFYAVKYWSKQGKSLLDEWAKENIESVDSTIFIASGGLEHNFAFLNDYPFEGSIPSIREVLESYPDKLWITSSIRTNVSTTELQPSANQLNEAFKLVRFAKGLGVIEGSIAYSYTDPNFSQKNEYGTAILRYTIKVDADKLDTIERPEQLENYFKDNAS